MKETEIRNPHLLDRYVELVQEDVKRLFDSGKFVSVSCPACGDAAQILEFTKMGFSYVSCPRCESLYTSPRPTQEQLDLFYSKAESARFFAEEFIGPYTEARREKIFRPRVQEIASFFPELADGKIGDIGAGTGIFLEELGKVWQQSKRVAIEPSEKMAELCRNKGMAVIPKMLEDVETEEGAFDLLCSFELFEHLYSPKAFLEKIYTLLKDGGFLYLTTLNGKGFDIQLLWEKHNNVNPPHHLNFCNPDAMRLLFYNCGFEVTSLETPGKLDWDIVEQRMKRDHISVGRLWDTVAKADEECKEQLQEWIRQSRLSSHMRIIAQKR